LFGKSKEAVGFIPTPNCSVLHGTWVLAQNSIGQTALSSSAKQTTVIAACVFCLAFRKLP
jgi:hypothetical protein